MRRSFCLLLPLVLGACAVSNTIEALDDRCPPPEFGRPAWVRVPAGVGAWIGGIVGGVASIVLLPVTYPISLLADDGLGEYGSADFMFFPALGLASVGHALVGTPFDAVDWVFHRAWVDAPDPVTSYEFVPLEGPSVPEPDVEKK